MAVFSIPQYSHQICPLSNYEEKNAVNIQGVEALIEKEIIRSEELGIDNEENSMAVNMLDGVIELPFQKSDMEYIGEKTIRRYFDKIRLHLAKENHTSEEQIHLLSSDKQLKTMCGEAADCEWLLKVLLFKDILQKVQLENYIDVSKVKVGLLDSGNGITEYLLKILIKQCNFLTVFTEREGDFEELRDNIYIEEGLMIDFTELEKSQLEQVDVLIDIQKEGYRYYKYLKKEALILVLSANVENIEGIIAKRGKRKTIYDIEAGVQSLNKREEINIFTEVLYWKNWKAAYMIEHFMKNTEVEEGEELCKEYGMTLRGIKYI